MREIRWVNEREFVVGGVKFYCSLDDYSLQTTADRFVILKDRDVLKNYEAVFAGSSPKNILEFGIFQGGSAALFTLWFDLQKFVGIDCCAPIAAFDEFCRTHEVGEKIRSYYGVSQTDRRRVQEIVHAEFDGVPIDVVIDDASHLYRFTRRSFAIAFPMLRPGGTYVIEDWGWAHWPKSEFFMGETALSKLIMELIMVCASRPDLISEVRVYPSFVFIRKSPDAPPLPDFTLSAHYRTRGVALVGSRDIDIAGLARVLAEGLKTRMKRARDRLRSFGAGRASL